MRELTLKPSLLTDDLPKKKGDKAVFDRLYHSAQMGMQKKQQLVMERELETSRRDPIRAKSPPNLMIEPIEEEEMKIRGSTISPARGGSKSRNFNKTAA